jgi:uncharacterized membrane protein YccC
VISALFVIQPYVGGTIGSALGRIGGIALGTGIGLVCVLTLGRPPSAILLELLLAMTALGFITGLRPKLRYALVPAAFIILAPGSDPVEKAWQGAAAIGLGAVIGALAGLLVFPEPAHRALERRLGEALQCCGDLLSLTVASLLHEGSADHVRACADEIKTKLWAAGGAAAQSRYPNRLRRRPHHPRPRVLLRAIERLWHSLLAVTRAGQSPLPERTREILTPALQSFAESGASHLQELGKALRRNTEPSSPKPVDDRVQALGRALDHLRQEGTTAAMDRLETERTFVIAFAIQQINQELDQIATLFSAKKVEHE